MFQRLISSASASPAVPSSSSSRVAMMIDACRIDDATDNRMEWNTEMHGQITAIIEYVPSPLPASSSSASSSDASMAEPCNLMQAISRAIESTRRHELRGVAIEQHRLCAICIQQAGRHHVSPISIDGGVCSKCHTNISRHMAHNGAPLSRHHDNDEDIESIKHTTLWAPVQGRQLYDETDQLEINNVAGKWQYLQIDDASSKQPSQSTSITSSHQFRNATSAPPSSPSSPSPSIQFRVTDIEWNDTQPARKAEFDRVNKLFQRFMGQQQAVLNRVTFIDNPWLEREFLSTTRRTIDRALDAQSCTTISSSNHQQHQWRDDDDEKDYKYHKYSNREWRQWIINHLEHYQARIPGNESLNLVGAWRGDLATTIMQDAASGLSIPAPLADEHIIRALDDKGFFGNGAYFTQYPNYGEVCVCVCLCLIGAH